MSGAVTVVKLGGSLLDLPDLGRRLKTWLAFWTGRRLVLVPGGGPTADVIRAFDRQHQLGEEASHWLALHALTLNAAILAALLPEGTLEVVQRLEDCPDLWRSSVVPVLDAHAFARVDEGRPGCLPHRWIVTSDSLAARVAVVCGAAQLILLKSVTIPEGISWSEASAAGFVDSYFPELAGHLACIRAINFRQWQPETAAPSSDH